MRKLIVQQWATIDNIVAEEDGGISFINAAPFAQAPADVQANVMEFIDGVDTMILGANTYQMFVEYWPTNTTEGEFAERLNQLDKYVASTKLTSAPWGDYPEAKITSDPVATIQELKQQDGKDIVLWGSLTLMQSMFQADLVDEVQLRVCPTTRGKGTHMFKDRRDMKMLQARPLSDGVVLLSYELKKS